MHRRVEVEATIGHSVDRVFAYLADPPRWHEFAPAVVFRRQIGDQLPRIGTRWMATDRIGPFRFHFIDELAELEPNRRVVWLSSAPLNSRVEYVCTPVKQGAAIRASYEGDISGLLRLLTWWMPLWVVRWILAQDFRRLRGLLDRDAHAARRWRVGYHSDVELDGGLLATAVGSQDDTASG